MTIALSSRTDDSNLKVVAEEIRDDLLDLPEVSTVNLEFIRPLEIAIEVSEFTLRQYGLTLGQISQAISRASLDLPWWNDSQFLWGNNASNEGSSISGH